MKLAWVLLLGMWIAISSSGTAAEPTAPAGHDPVGAHLFVTDGQIRLHPFRVFIDRTVSESMRPRLRLLTFHSFLRTNEGETNVIRPEIVAVNQSEVHELEGTKSSYIGTVLVFDLSKYPEHKIKPMTRVDPILEWDEKTADGTVMVQKAIGPTVYLGNLPTATIYSVVAIGVLILLLVYFVRGSGQPSLNIFCGPDGSLSLWRVQTAVWTAAVGAMLLLYGLLRKEVPSIPDTLVMLMGMTVITGGVSHWQDKKMAREQASDSIGDNSGPVSGALTGDLAQPTISSGTPVNTQPAAVVPRSRPSCSDLICDLDENGGRELSITRAQLVFWTGLTVGLFVMKTVLEGILWDVPIQLVALMGISQASYLGPKLIKK